MQEAWRQKAQYTDTYTLPFTCKSGSYILPLTASMNEVYDKQHFKASVSYGITDMKPWREVHRTCDIETTLYLSLWDETGI